MPDEGHYRVVIDNPSNTPLDYVLTVTVGGVDVPNAGGSGNVDAQGQVVHEFDL